MCLLALSLQVLLFTHTIIWLRDGVSLKGDSLELLLLLATIVTTSLAIATVSFQSLSRWLRSLYVLICAGTIPLGLTAIVMGLCMYATTPFGSFESSSGTIITLKEYAGLLGCSVRPYIIQGLFEQQVYREDNYIHCFTPFIPSGSTPVDDVRWSPDETQLILTIDQEDYIFELMPLPTSSSS